MLISRWFTVPVVLSAAVALTVTGAVSMPSGVAAQGVHCPNGRVVIIDGRARCVPAHGEVPPDGGPLVLPRPAGAGGSNICRRPGGVATDASADEKNLHGPAEIPCSRDDRGRYSSGWDCYLLGPDENVPLDDDRIRVRRYEEHEADSAQVFLASCFPSEEGNPLGFNHWWAGPHGAAQPGQGDLAQWRGSGVYVALPPPEFAPGEPDILGLWIDAVNAIEMYGPQPVTAPPLDTGGLVRLPMWLWSEVADDAWPAAPLHGFAQGGTTRVDAYAEPVFMEWNMGEGRDPVECPVGSPGVAWQSGIGLDLLDPPAGACTYTYERSSRNEPGGVFEVTAITTWRVWWDINDAFDGELELRVGRTTTYQVNELQVLTRRS